MGDLISRSALIELFDNYCVSNCEVCAYEKHTLQCGLIEIAPVVEAVPVVHGEWFGNTCSACGLNWDENMVNNADDWGYFEPMPNFCPNCGADMRKKVQNER